MILATKPGSGEASRKRVDEGRWGPSTCGGGREVASALREFASPSLRAGGGSTWNSCPEQE